MRMSAGDFVEVYSARAQAQRFNCVVTCFFLDTAHNIVQYLEIIASVLKVQACDAAPLQAARMGFQSLYHGLPYHTCVLRVLSCAVSNYDMSHRQLIDKIYQILLNGRATPSEYTYEGQAHLFQCLALSRQT